MEILNSNKFCVLPKNVRSSRRQYDKKVDGYLLTGSINHKYIVKVRPFVTAKTDDMYDHVQPAQRNPQPNVYISRVGTNDLQT